MPSNNDSSLGSSPNRENSKLEPPSDALPNHSTQLHASSVHGESTDRPDPGTRGAGTGGGGTGESTERDTKFDRTSIFGDGKSADAKSGADHSSADQITAELGVGTKVGSTKVDGKEDSVSSLSNIARSGSASNQIIGEYLVLEEIGRGGMGVVYKARHMKLNRVVALKMILGGRFSSKETARRFVSEARAVAKLQHPGIVQIFEIGEYDGVPYFSLEYVSGRDLQRQLNGQPQDAKAAAELVERLAKTMQYAHDHGIPHRDLKPANVLMNEEGLPKIADFGLAKEVDEGTATATSQGTIMGSPSYMAPEQARGEISSISPRSDLYSLGAILYQLLTGRPPFITSRPVETVLQVVNNDPVRPRVLQPGLPLDIETICLKAMQKEQSTRYTTCRDFADDLRRFINGEPIVARPVSRIERTWRWCKPILVSRSRRQSPALCWSSRPSCRRGLG